MTSPHKKKKNNTNIVKFNKHLTFQSFIIYSNKFRAKANYIRAFFQYIAKLKMLALGIRLAPQGNIPRTQCNIGRSQNRKITNLSENI